MKKVKNLFVIISCLLMLTGCTNSYKYPVISAEDTIKENTIKEKNYKIDDIYNKIKSGKFDNLKLVNLDYDQINKTTIIIGKQSFGSRDTLTDKNGNSTQRCLVFSMEDGAQITVILGELSSGEQLKKNMLTYYTDDLKNINSASEDVEKLPVHIDSSLFSVNNIIINVVSVNIKNELDMDSVIKFKEDLVDVISSITN